MAARRLLIVMLLLLGLSALAASQLPPQAVREGTTTTAEEETETGPTGTLPSGELLTYRISVGAPKAPIRVMEARPGDQISLQVRSRHPVLVEIPALGLIEAAGPGVPARFQFLAQESGSYGVRVLNPNRLIARIEVSA